MLVICSKVFNIFDIYDGNSQNDGIQQSDETVEITIYLFIYYEYRI